MTLPIFKNNRGRKPLDESERKGRIAISLDADVLQKLEGIPNKSALINDLLRACYFPKKISLETANRLQHSLALINRAFKYEPLTIAGVANLLGLEKAGILQAYFDGVEEPSFKLLEEYASLFGLSNAWMKDGQGEPFLSTESIELLATDYLDRIKQLKPSIIYFIKSSCEENKAGIVLKLSKYRYVYLRKTWVVNGQVGVTGQNQIYALYKMIKKLQEFKRGSSFESIGYQDFYCQSGTVSEKVFNNLFCGRVYPPSVIPFYDDRWWDDLTDIYHSFAYAEGYVEKYGKEFLKAHTIIKGFVEAEQHKLNTM
jgi:hypothetical protein